MKLITESMGIDGIPEGESVEAREGEPKTGTSMLNGQAEETKQPDRKRMRGSYSIGVEGGGGGQQDQRPKRSPVTCSGIRNNVVGK